MNKLLQVLVLLTISYSSHAAVISYDLHQPSGRYHKFMNDPEDKTTFTPYTGSIAIEELLVINGGYYQIDINTESIVNSHFPNFSFNVSEDDILNGAILTYGLDTVGGLIVNNLDEVRLGCPECPPKITLNLGILEYQFFGGGFFILNGNTTTSASPFLSYDIGSSELDITNFNEIYLTSVPVPASIWLFSSGLLLLMRLNKKVQKV